MCIGEFPKIEAIFLVQFHPDLGPIVRVSVPKDAVDLGENRGNASNGCARGNDDSRVAEGSVITIGSNPGNLGCFQGGEQPVEVIELIKRPANPRAVAMSSGKIDFNAIQALVIPKLTQFERLITVYTGKFKLMCYPVAVEGQYERNALIFNMCFAFDINADTKCYGPVVKRVGCLLKELEISNSLLSNSEGEPQLASMMRQLVSKLNDYGECQIELDLKSLSQSMSSAGISIRLFPYYGNPQVIEPYHVPVRTIDFEMTKQRSALMASQVDMPGDAMWDLVVDRVLEHMDNTSHVRRIVSLTRIPEDTVILALQHLDYYGCITIVDIFQFGNIYETQYRVMDLYRNAWLQRECYSYVTRDGQASDMVVDELIRMYLTIRKRKTVAEWILENEIDTERLDVRKFIVFGVIHQLLRRVHCYPVMCGPEAKLCDGEQSSVADDNGASVAETASLGNGSCCLGPRLVEMLDGTHHMDEVCVVMDKDAATLRQMFDAHGNIEYMYL
ncbi:Nitrogen permease regulator 2 [Coemansia sp. BCRC 34301]|nr:Nitrogen permease regulator 2 [Coemansia sp. BCRC 34301]